MTENMSYMEILKQITTEEIWNLSDDFFESPSMNKKMEISVQLPEFFKTVLKQEYNSLKDDKDITFEEYAGLILCGCILHQTGVQQAERIINQTCLKIRGDKYD